MSNKAEFNFHVHWEEYLLAEMEGCVLRSMNSFRHFPLHFSWFKGSSCLFFSSFIFSDPLSTFLYFFKSKSSRLPSSPHRDTKFKRKRGAFFFFSFFFHWRLLGHIGCKMGCQETLLVKLTGTSKVFSFYNVY